LAKEFAYVSDGDVYFRVAKAQDYAKLAGKNLSELIEGASGRTDAETARKESSADFALWKAAKATEISWETPWGRGRPGWHLECSVMSGELLGETLDIHGGGQDLEFPHHTNEIAQSEAHTGKKFVNVWMHNAFVNVEGEKMSKSLGNFKTVHEMLEAGLDSQVLRFFLATTHYRKPLDFTDEALERAANNLKKIENAYRNLSNEGSADPSEFRLKFIDAMDEDFHVANGLSVFYDFISWVNSGNSGKKVKQFFDEVLEILGIRFETQVVDPEIDAQVAEYDQLRVKKDFASSDKIRADLKTQGIVLETTKEGTKWYRA
ncbi:MAG: class I tRNA ligase family protein, partial [Streptococcaceae bacterium]|nr:class I tRNA ligase family protein [Streptococcaceae bacterium]